MKRRAAILAIATTAVLAGAPVAHAATVGPTPHDYGNQNVGTTGAPTTFSLYTSGGICTSPDVTMTFCLVASTPPTDTTALGGGPGTVITSGDFVIHNLSCPYPSNSATPPASISPTPPAFCQFEASFAPTTGGPLSKTLTFTDAGGPTATLTLTGTGIAPAATTPTTTPTTTTAIPKKKKCKKKKHRASSAAKKKCKKRKR